MLKENSAYQNKVFKRLKGFILTVFGGNCYFCERYNDVIEVHHIDGIADNNNIFNLMPLCPSCHKLAHKMQVSKSDYREKLLDKLSILQIRLMNLHDESVLIEQKYSGANLSNPVKIQPFRHHLGEE